MTVPFLSLMGFLWVFFCPLRALSWYHTLSSCHSSLLTSLLPEQCCWFSLFYPSLSLLQLLFMVHLVVTMCCSHLLVSCLSSPWDLVSHQPVPKFPCSSTLPLILYLAKHFLAGIHALYLCPDLVYIMIMIFEFIYHAWDRDTSNIPYHTVHCVVMANNVMQKYL